MSRLRYVCMPGQSYTGSTLLAFLLNAHPACASVGAASGLVPRADAATYRCSCGELLGECTFWKAVRASVEDQGVRFDPLHKPWPTAYRVSPNRVLNVLGTRSLRNGLLNDGRDALVARVPPVRDRRAAITEANVALARAVCEHTGVGTFVDSSRDPLRPRYLAASPQLEVKVLHLVRDARGNVASILRHVPGLGVEEAARRWYRANAEARRAIAALPPADCTVVRYEDLCADPQAESDRISDHVGVPRAPVPEDFQAVEHHILGNEMRLGGAGQIRADERWREALTPDDLDVIARRCGDLNRELGYAWP